MRLLNPFRPAVSKALHAALLAAMLAALPSPARAAEGESGLDIKYMYYQDRNEVWNHTPAFAFFRRLSSLLRLQWNQEVDAVSGASRRLGLGNTGQLGDHAAKLDGVSGASRREIRHSEQATLAYANQGRAAAASFYFSDENDYRSYSPAVSASWDFNDRNTTLSAAWSLFLDSFRPTGGFAGQGGDRRIQSLKVGLTQLVSSLSLFSVSVHPIRSAGYLGHPYNPVVLADGAMITEELPDRKLSVAFTGTWIQGYLFRDLLGSVHVEARHYRDDWKLVSNALDVKWHQYLLEGTYLRLRARFYRQGTAGFYKASYAGDEAYRTSDIRFSPFQSLTFGAKLASRFPESWTESALLPDRWDIGYDQGTRDTEGQGDAVHPLFNYQLHDAGTFYRQGTFMAGLGFDF
jgi:hypothetical protein